MDFNMGQASLPIMTTIPELNMMDDEVEDVAEEKKLMSILLRLKTAQSSMDENRQRSTGYHACVIDLL